MQTHENHDREEEHDTSENEIEYEVSQAQLDAVDRMLEELDMDEQFDRVPAAFRIVQDQQEWGHVNGNATSFVSSRSTPAQAHSRAQHQHQALDSDEDMPDNRHGDQNDDEEGEDEGAEPFGYIPLDQDDDDGSDSSDEDHLDKDTNGYDQMNREEEDHQAEEAEDEGQGYDGYLHSTTRDGHAIVPVIPAAVEIEQDAQSATEPIPEDDLKTIAQVMNSFSLPAPDWAKSIPEERWLPKIVQQAAGDDKTIPAPDES